MLTLPRLLMAYDGLLLGHDAPDEVDAAPLCRQQQVVALRQTGTV